MQAMAAEGIVSTLDQMDSDIISRLKTPDGALVLLPYPTVTVDMGQYLARMKTPSEIEALWVDYVSELATEARADPGREATTVVIGSTIRRRYPRWSSGHAARACAAQER